MLMHSCRKVAAWGAIEGSIEGAIEGSIEGAIEGSIEGSMGCSDWGCSDWGCSDWGCSDWGYGRMCVLQYWHLTFRVLFAIFLINY